VYAARAEPARETGRRRFLPRSQCLLAGGSARAAGHPYS